MRRKFTLLAISILAAVGLTMSVSFAAVPAQAATNLLVNGNFATGNTSGWTCGSGDTVVTSPTHNGDSYALAGTPTGSDYARCSQVVSVQPSSQYTLTGWVEGNYVFLGDSGTGTSDTNNWTPSATSWQELSTSFTTGASTTSVTIYINGWYAQPTFYADDLSLTGPGGGGTPPPGAPTNLAVTGTTSSTVSLSWTAPSGTVTGYNVYQNGTKTKSVTGTSTTISGLSASTTYTYTVTAYNSGGESGHSNQVSATTSAGGTPPPGTPANLAVTGTTSSSVSLSWTASSGTVTGYNVYQNGTKTKSVTGTSTTVTGLSASTTYTYTVTAYNSGGESGHSNQVSATTSAGGGGGLPAHLLEGYWQDFTNGAQPLTLAAVPTSYNIIAVAFGNSDSTPGQVTFSLDSGLSSALGGYTQQQFINDIATLHSRGQKVILSVGGANGTISVNDATSAANFASSVSSIIQQYGFDGVDIDLENGVNPTYMASALEQLHSDVGNNLIITMAPQTVDTQSTGGDYFQLALNIKSILTMINTQYYNSGSMNGCDGNVYSEGTENFITALTCIELQGGLSASQVGVGLPASTSAAGSGYVSPSVVNASLDCLAARQNCGSFVPSASYPGIRGAMTWSINWDASNGYNFANTVAPHLASLP